MDQDEHPSVPMALRWGADVRFVPSSDVMAPDPQEQLDAPEIAGTMTSARVTEVTFQEGVSLADVERVLAELATRAPLDGTPVLGRYPVGPLRVRCDVYRPIRGHMLAMLRGSVLRGSSDGVTATFTLDGGSAVEFPAGCSAVDDPLTVLDERGRVVAAAGDLVDGGGGFVQDGDGKWLWRGDIRRSRTLPR